MKFLYIRVGERKNPLHIVSALDAPSAELSKGDAHVTNGRNFSISFLGKDPSECTKSRHIPTYEEWLRSSMIKTASKKSLCRFHAQELVLHLINRAAITSIFRQENRYSYYRNDPVKYDLTKILEVEYYKMWSKSTALSICNISQCCFIDIRFQHTRELD